MLHQVCNHVHTEEENSTRAYTESVVNAYIAAARFGNSYQKQCLADLLQSCVALVICPFLRAALPLPQHSRLV